MMQIIRTTSLRVVRAILGAAPAAFACLGILLTDGLASADEPDVRHKMPASTRQSDPSRRTGSGGGSLWWLGPGGIALALAAAGAASVAARRLGATGGASTLKIVDRVSLTPKHTVFIVRARDRLIVLGTGPQGAPAVLGELDPLEDEPTPTPRVGREPSTSPARESDTFTRIPHVTIVKKTEQSAGANA